MFDNRTGIKWGMGDCVQNESDMRKARLDFTRDTLVLRSAQDGTEFRLRDQADCVLCVFIESVNRPDLYSSAEVWRTEQGGDRRCVQRFNRVSRYVHPFWEGGQRQHG